MTIKSKMTIAAITIVGGATLLVGGAASGYAIATNAERPSATTAAKVTPCNLRLTWDRVQQEFLAVYEDSNWISYTGRYGRTANLSCSDDQILAWQEQRRDNGLDPAVCRPVLHDDTTMGDVRSIGCAVPTMVVTDGSR